MDIATTDINLDFILDQILSTIGHKMGNSVNSLKITVDVLQGNFEIFDDEKHKEYLSRLSVLIRQQQNLIESLKSFCRFNVQASQAIDFIPFWDNIVEYTGRRLKAKAIRFHHLCNVGPSKIMGDKMALRAVLTSILDNAIEALEAGERPEICLRAERKENTLMLAIKDNGCGIRSQDLDKICLPLFSTKTGKSGMGLATSKKLLAAMGGKIRINSTPDNGTQAEVWLQTMSDQPNLT